MKLSRRALLARADYKPWVRSDKAAIVELAKARAVRSWAELPWRTKHRYSMIAECFPGVQLYACGSRVAGHYADEGDTAAQAARAKAGHNKPVSDFDFMAPSGAKEVKSLPPWADRVQMPVRDEERVPIPVFQKP